MEADFEGAVPHLFWAVELVPGKEYTTTVPADLHIAQAVLPATAKDAGRSVVSIQFSDEDEESETKEKAIAIASLRLDNQDSQALEVIVDEGATITLTVSGKNPVHLSGYYVPDENGDDEGLYDDEVDSDEFGSEEEGEEEEESEDEEAVQQAIKSQLAAKRKQVAQNGGDAKKAKVEAGAAPQQPKQPQQQQKPKQQEQAKPKQAQQQKAQPKVFPNGLQAITTQEGQGAEATKGRKVSVKYVGKLTKNGKVFDKSSKPFTFTLGAREVITGWDLGVAGMKEELGGISLPAPSLP
jgi:FK506-binding nuclear protein